LRQSTGATLFIILLFCVCVCERERERERERESERVRSCQLIAPIIVPLDEVEDIHHGEIASQYDKLLLYDRLLHLSRTDITLL
jgi:hypothetical protein